MTERTFREQLERDRALLQGLSERERMISLREVSTSSKRLAGYRFDDRGVKGTPNR